MKDEIEFGHTADGHADGPSGRAELRYIEAEVKMSNFRLGLVLVALLLALVAGQNFAV
ncbi:MAG: hypothetical protein ACE5KW_02535 [Dehalococcoidia bacterium]